MIVSKRLGCCTAARTPEYGDFFTDAFKVVGDVLTSVVAGPAIKAERDRAAQQAQAQAAAAAAKASTVKTVAIAGVAGVAVLGTLAALLSRK